MKPKHDYRLPPCPSYDLAGTQAWLEGLAQKGLYLRQDASFFLGMGVFEEGEAAPVRYRLEAALTDNSPLSRREGPAEQAVDLARDFGWDFVCRRGSFDIYRTADPQAPELNTDPTLQAKSLRVVEKRLFRTLLSLVFWLAADLLLYGCAGVLAAAIHYGLWLPLLLTVVLVGTLISAAYRAWFLSRLRKTLQRGEPLVPSAVVKGRGLRYQVCRCLHLGALLVLVAVYLIHWSVGGINRSEERSQLDDFPGQPPFATVADLAPEGATLSRRISHASRYRKELNTFARWSCLLAEDVIEWEEYRTITLPSGEEQRAWITVNYYRLESEWLAKGLFWELSLQTGIAQRSFTEPLELPDLPVDDTAAYHRFNDYLLLREGDRILYVQLYDYSDLDFAESAVIFANSLQ